MAAKGKGVTLDEVPDSNTFPTGHYHMEVEEIERTTSKKSGLLMYKAVLRCVDAGPAEELVGLQHTEYFVIGTEDDPEAEESVTVKKKAKRIKKFFKACGISTEGKTIDDCLPEAEDQVFLARIFEKEETEGDFAGQMRNNIGRFMQLGEKEPGPDEDADGGGAASGAGAGKTGAKKPAPRQVEEEEGEGEGEAEAAPAPAPAKAAKPAKAAAPAKKAAPAPAAAASKGNGAAKPAKMIQCRKCGDDVAQPDFAAHMDAHDAEGESEGAEAEAEG